MVLDNNKADVHQVIQQFKSCSRLWRLCKRCRRWCSSPRMKGVRILKLSGYLLRYHVYQTGAQKQLPSTSMTGWPASRFTWATWAPIHNNGGSQLSTHDSHPNSEAFALSGADRSPQAEEVDAIGKESYQSSDGRFAWDAPWGGSFCKGRIGRWNPLPCHAALSTWWPWWSRSDSSSSWKPSSIVDGVYGDCSTSEMDPMEAQSTGDECVDPRLFNFDERVEPPDEEVGDALPWPQLPPVAGPKCFAGGYSANFWVGDKVQWAPLGWAGAVRAACKTKRICRRPAQAEKVGGEQPLRRQAAETKGKATGGVWVKEEAMPVFSVWRWMQARKSLPIWDIFWMEKGAVGLVAVVNTWPPTATLVRKSNLELPRSSPRWWKKKQDLLRLQRR